MKEEYIGIMESLLSNLVRQEGRDLTARQMAILFSCAKKSPQTVRGLSKNLSLTKPVITRSADKLEEIGFLKRIPDEKDKRSVLLVLSNPGQQYVENIANHLNKMRA